MALRACLTLADHCLNTRDRSALDVSAALVDRAACGLEAAPSSKSTEAFAVEVVERAARLVEAYASHRIVESLRHLRAAQRVIDGALFGNDEARHRMQVRLGAAAMNALVVYEDRFDAVVRSEGYLASAGDELLETARVALFEGTVGGPRAADARSRLAELEQVLDHIDDVFGTAERQIERGYCALTDDLDDYDRDLCAEVSAQLIVGSEQLAVAWEIAVAQRRPLTMLHALRVMTSDAAPDAAIHAADAALRGFLRAREEWSAFVECVATRELPVADVFRRGRFASGQPSDDPERPVITQRMRSAVCPPTDDDRPKRGMLTLTAPT